LTVAPSLSLLLYDEGSDENLQQPKHQQQYIICDAFPHSNKQPPPCSYVLWSDLWRVILPQALSMR